MAGAPRSLKPLVTVLAFFAATEKYGYVDRVGGSMSPLTALEALRDAVRDYLSVCREGCYEEKTEEGEVRYRCPSIEGLDEAVRVFEETVDKLMRDRSGVAYAEFLKLTRSLALEALARASTLKLEECK